MWHCNRGSFIALVIEVLNFYINKPTRSMAFQAPNFHQLDESLLQKPSDLFAEFNNLTKPGFLAIMNEKLAKLPDEEFSIKQLYLYKMRLFEYDSRNRNKR